VATSPAPDARPQRRRTACDSTKDTLPADERAPSQREIHHVAADGASRSQDAGLSLRQDAVRRDIAGSPAGMRVCCCDSDSFPSGTRREYLRQAEAMLNQPRRWRARGVGSAEFAQGGCGGMWVPPFRAIFTLRGRVRMQASTVYEKSLGEAELGAERSLTARVRIGAARVNERSLRREQGLAAAGAEPGVETILQSNLAGVPQAMSEGTEVWSLCLQVLTRLAVDGEGSTL